jgi:EmrB/QacA subfamily drug resistance transporter
VAVNARDITVARAAADAVALPVGGEETVMRSRTPARRSEVRRMSAAGTASRPAAGYSRYRILWPLVPAMAMVMIDFTIVSISVTTIQSDLHLSATAAQWTVTAYALATAMFVALGGKLGDVLGHKRIVVIGVVLFAGASLLCGLTPDGRAISEAWLIAFRGLEGVGGALLIPSTTVLVLNSFPPEERGKGLSLFFIVAGLFTAIGPIAGSYLTEYWTWRAIFWINIPVAIFALSEMARASIPDVKHPAKIDLAGTFLIVAGMGLAVLGIQQSTVWGWGSFATLGSIAAGLVLLAVLVVVELRADEPLIDVRSMARNRAFSVDNAVIFLFFTAWLAIFLFGSMYFQISAGQPPSQAGFSILTVFYPFFVTSRIGGVLMDKVGSKLPVVLGLAATAAGLALWAYELPELTHSATLPGMLLTGAGLGLVMSPINTDALNRVGEAMRGQASGIVQTTRNFGSAVGVAALGTILLLVQQDKTPALLEEAGVPPATADQITDSIMSGTPSAGGDVTDPAAHAIADAIGEGFAESLQVAFYASAGIAAAAFLLALFLMAGGRQVGVE